MGRGWKAFRLLVLIPIQDLAKNLLFQDEGPGGSLAVVPDTYLIYLKEKLLFPASSRDGWFSILGHNLLLNYLTLFILSSMVWFEMKCPHLPKYQTGVG